MLARYTSKVFSPCPDGTHAAVCVDVQDLGQVTTPFGEKYRVRLIFQIADIDPETGERHTAVLSLTNSMYMTAKLRLTLEAWRGAKFTEAEARSFDLDRLIGQNAVINVQRSVNGAGKTVAFVASVAPAMRGAAKLRPENYVRLQDRTTSPSTPTAPSREPGSDDVDDVEAIYGAYDSDLASETEVIHE